MSTYVLPQRMYRQIKKTALEPMLPNLVGRRVVPKDPEITKGAQEATRDKFKASDEDARFIPKGGRYGVITPSGEEVTVYIRKIGQAFIVTDEDLESSIAGGRPLDKQAIQLASRKIAEKEDFFILRGYANAGELGLYGNANQTKACSNKWDTTNGNPYEDINDAQTKLEANDFEAKFLILNNQDYGLIRRRDAYGNVYRRQIIDELGISETNILKSSALLKGTGLLCDSGPTIAELKIVEEITPQDPVRTTRDTQQINIRERMGLDVYENNAFCTITNIS